MVKLTFISLIPPLFWLSHREKLTNFQNTLKKNSNPQQKKSYANATSLSNQHSPSVPKNIVKEMLKIKETFPNLSNKKIEQVQKVINGSNNKIKLRITMTTKSLSQKQVIIPMSNNITKEFIKDSNSHVTNINHTLKAIKSNILANFIHVKDKSIVLMTNNVLLDLDLQEIEKYIKNSLSSNTDKVSSARLSQSKSYLKIVGISFNNEKTNSRISLEEIEGVLKNNHIFNNIILASKPHIIKISSKSDIAIIWINIWDTQMGQNAKTIINR